MVFSKDLLEKIEILEGTGQQFVDQLMTFSAEEGSISAPDFHRWRVNVSKFLLLSLGPSNYYYECFWKGVTMPELDHLQEGLRLLATVKSELEAVFLQERPFPGRDREAVEEILPPEL